MPSRPIEVALSPTDTTAHYSHAERIDKLPTTALHLFAVALCAAGFTFDLLEIALGSALSAVFSLPPHKASSQELSWLLASVYVGAAIGAPLMGWLADKWGRRRVIMAVLLWLGAFSLFAAASMDTAHLTLFRGLSGVALGAYPPLMIAYLTDLLPPARRGMLILVAIALASLGPVAGIFLVRWLTPLQPLGIEAWRWGFIVGGAGATLVGLAFRALPESPRWLASQGRLICAEVVLARFERSKPLSVLASETQTPVEKVQSPSPMHTNFISNVQRWSVVGLLFHLSPWATVAFPLLTGAVLTQKGFNLSDTLLFVGLSTFGPFAGTLLAAQVVDRAERRIALCLCALAMAASGWCFIKANIPLWLVVSSVGFNVFSSIYVSVLNVYGAEISPTMNRALSISAAWSMNRIGAVVAPFVLLPLLQTGGLTSMFIVISVTLGVSVLLLLLAPPGKQLHSLL